MQGGNKVYRGGFRDDSGVTYLARLDQIRSAYIDKGDLPGSPYSLGVDWLEVFTPIERITWGEIRGFGLPFFPQYPIKQFFADFADPVTKIVIECDGKAYHSDKKRDANRDQQMNEAGWRVFRISGSDCCRVRATAAEIDYEYPEGWMSDASAINSMRDWYLNTVDGLIAAIAERYYGKAGYQADSIGGLFYASLLDEVLYRRETQGTRTEPT